MPNLRRYSRKIRKGSFYSVPKVQNSKSLPPNSVGNNRAAPSASIATGVLTDTNILGWFCVCDNANWPSPIYRSTRIKPPSFSSGGSERLKTSHRGEPNSAKGRVRICSPFLSSLPCRRVSGFFSDALATAPGDVPPRFPLGAPGRGGSAGRLCSAPGVAASPPSVRLCAGHVQNPAFGEAWEAAPLLSPFWRNPSALMCDFLAMPKPFGDDVGEPEPPRVPERPSPRPHFPATGEVAGCGEPGRGVAWGKVRKDSR